VSGANKPMCKEIFFYLNKKETDAQLNPVDSLLKQNTNQEEILKAQTV
jgi:hypothetical protein